MSTSCNCFCGKGSESSFLCPREKVVRGDIAGRGAEEAFIAYNRWGRKILFSTYSYIPRGILQSAFFPKSSDTISLEHRSNLPIELQFLLAILTSITLRSKSENRETLTTYNRQRLQQQFGYDQGAVWFLRQSVLISGTSNPITQEKVKAHCWQRIARRQPSYLPARFLENISLKIWSHNQSSGFYGTIDHQDICPY